MNDAKETQSYCATFPDVIVNISNRQMQLDNLPKTKQTLVLYRFWHGKKPNLVSNEQFDTIIILEKAMQIECATNLLFAVSVFETHRINQ